MELKVTLWAVFEASIPICSRVNIPATGGLFQFLRGRNIDVEQLWKFVSTYDYVAGDFMWTGIDHLGEARWPMKARRPA